MPTLIRFPGSTIANDFTTGKYKEMLNLAEAMALDPHALGFHFSDVSSRGPGRPEYLCGYQHSVINNIGYNSSAFVTVPPPTGHF